RGEIACRIIRTARRLGLRTVAVYSVADAGASHVQMADDAQAIGASAAAESYLRADKIIAAAKAAGAQAIHPGYGFLAENADFAQACADAGIVFVGPPADAIRAMGAKDGAKRLMQQSGVPVVPGYHGSRQEPEFLAGEAKKIGYPVLIKASMGGGGKGMRLIDDAKAFAQGLASARREASAAFGNDHVLVEKFIANPRHIEVQIFADQHGHVVHMFERDCSLQRRHQKVIEEAPAPGMTPGLRAAMTKAATSAARSVAYEGAGTVEFIVDGSAPLSDQTPFYFMEMNTRLQVEHPVTEMVTGLDLVEWQLRVAGGEPLPIAQAHIALDGHAVEARIYAENPASGFLPSTGRLLAFRGGDQDQNFRLETGVREGDEITGYYDPMIAKLVAHGDNRAQAFARLDDGLAALAIAGPQTNQAFLRLCLADENFVSGAFDTGLIDRELEAFIAILETPDEHLVRAGVGELARRAAMGGPDDGQGPWARNDGFQLGPARAHDLAVEIDGERQSTGITWVDGEVGVAGQGSDVPRNRAVTVVDDADAVIVVGGGRQMRLRLADPFAHDIDTAAGHGTLTAPMPGRVSLVEAVVGNDISAGDTVLVLEAMKMEHMVTAPFDGVLQSLSVKQGDQVTQGAALAQLMPHEPADQ
ncbi:MAG: biotin carboxylase N-terminal domain-containing protein, partial [Hyphomicrobiales bacterium]